MARVPSTRLAQLTTLIEQLSATPRYVGKQSRDLETAVARFLAGATHQASRQPEVARYRIDDLARVSGVTTRNIRVYRERGLLPAPRRVGRVTLYSDAHVSRLALISSMLSRGYALAHIDELLTAWQNGGQIADVLGLEHDLTEIQESGGVRSTTLAELSEAGIDDDAATRLAKLNVITIIADDEVTVDEPDVLNAILPLVTETRSAATVIDVVERVYPAFEALHQTLVEAADTLTTPAGGTSDQQLTEVTLTLIQLRALADAATRATLTQTTNTLLAQSLSDQTSGPTAD